MRPLGFMICPCLPVCKDAPWYDADELTGGVAAADLQDNSGNESSWDSLPSMVPAASSGNTQAPPTNDSAENRTATARKTAERAAIDLLARMERVGAHQIDEVVSQWRCSKNESRNRLKGDPTTEIHSDTAGGTHNSSVGTWHVSHIAEHYPNFVKLLNKWKIGRAHV